MREYVLTHIVMSRFKRMGIVLLCKKCGKPLEVGDVVVSNSKYKCKSLRYHKECYESLFIDA